MSAPRLVRLASHCSAEGLALAREMHVVEPVVAELEEVLAVVVLRLHQRRIAVAHAGRRRWCGGTRRGSRPSCRGCGRSRMSASASRSRKSATSVVVDVDRQIARLDARARRHEPGARRIERLIELADHLRIAADLHVGQQLRAQLVDLGQDETRRRVVVAVALEIVLQIQAEAHIVRPPGFAARAHLESRFLAAGPRARGRIGAAG